MSNVWWGKESKPRTGGIPSNSVRRPELLPSVRNKVTEELIGRTLAYTPEWTYRGSDDAGVALSILFGELMEPVLQRLNRMPEKALVEFLMLAGISPIPPRPASALLEFKVDDGAPGSVLVGEGFQVGASSPTGGRVIFETQRSFYAAPNKIEQILTWESGTYQSLENEGITPFLPFGRAAVPGQALYIGLSGQAAPGPSLTLGLRIASPPGTPPPSASGGIAPLPVPPPPTLRWEILDGGAYKPAEVASDETGGLFRSGVVELNLPRQWRQGQPDGLKDAPLLRWLRLRIVHGQFDEPPKLLFIKLNMTSALAVRTLRDEILEPVSESESHRWRLSAVPVLAKSLILEIDEGGLDSGVHRWQQVEDLSLFNSNDRVYELDLLTGEILFGDGRHGRAAPLGFRHIRAVRYQVGGGADGAVGAEAISTLLNSAPFIRSVKNPLPASGGAVRESQERALWRGPQEIRARGRAVTVADYSLLALYTRGADVARAFAVSGYHPLYPGLPIPGVVGVFVVPSDRGEGQPTPDEGTLASVAGYLSREAGPVGVEVVVAAPRYQSIRAEIGLVVDPAENVADTVGRVRKAVNLYFDPLKGGDDGEGWPFGGTLRYALLLRRIVDEEGVHAVPRLNLVLDGVRLATCQDHAIAPYALLWPESHEIILMQAESLS